MTFAWPWVALLLPLLWAIIRFTQPKDQHAIEHPYLRQLSTEDDKTRLKTSALSRWLWWLIWAFLVIALMRPQWVGPPLVQSMAGRSLYLTVDMSPSMEEQDMRWNGRTVERFQAMQAVVGEFIENRQSDFIGLVVFGSFADVQAPLTPDKLAVRDILFDLRPGMAGRETAIGDGLALASRQLRESESPDRVIVLLSDGSNNAGTVTPAEAIQVAQTSDIRVHTIGFGGEGQQNLLGFRFRGADIDEAMLQQIATQTGGQYFRAKSTSELQAIFSLIDELETSERDLPEQRLVNELYWWPLSVALAFIFVQSLLAALKSKAAIQ